MGRPQLYAYSAKDHAAEQRGLLRLLLLRIKLVATDPERLRQSLRSTISRRSISMPAVRWHVPIRAQHEAIDDRPSGAHRIGRRIFWSKALSATSSSGSGRTCRRIPRSTLLSRCANYESCFAFSPPLSIACFVSARSSAWRTPRTSRGYVLRCRAPWRPSLRAPSS